ncbi:glycosyltransferase family 2 protein [Mesoplasma photuris]|uniref:glycosyltransferase family 2 protein n=1 Tax=Mesoplasma photuris TaxID=217731 RepID=UPI0004E1A85E|nr:glycosyltransferase family 2 protein [Mesoplasma photuris]
MKLSFIIATQGKENLLFKTINSLKKQTVSDYEIIIVNDDPYVEKEAIEFLKDQFRENEKIIIALNSKGQGSGSNWNSAIQLANGEYFAFIKEGDILEPNYIEKISKITNSNKPKLDIIEYQIKRVGLVDDISSSILEPNVVYNLPTDTQVFAYISQTVYGKVFRRSYIKDFRINFRRSVRFDTLFLYKALGHARTLYVTSDVLITHKISVLKYSAFDLVNQWPHILNYYRRIGAFKELKDELNYAYYYQLTYDFLNIVKSFDNNQLYKKSLKYVEAKMENKIEAFTSKNSVFTENKQPKFNKRINTLNAFINAELRLIGK